jgi:predicted N-acetyltransferase YhbS
MITYENEASFDVAEREALLDRAFGCERRRKASERIREGRLPAEGLALVARDGDRLVGTVRLWPVEAGDRRPALLLGPLAVDESARGEGVGAALVRIALARAVALGHRAVILVGDEAYYRRFGFSAAPAAGLAMPGPFERHRLLAVELDPGALAGASGVIRPAGLPADAHAEPRPLAA